MARPEGWTPLHEAALYCRPQWARELLDRGLDANAADDGGNTPLHVASCAEVVDVLISHGADLKRLNKMGLTPLHTAARYGFTSAVLAMLKYVDSPDVRGANGVTPLHVAAYYKHPDIVEALLRRGADPNARDSKGRTPLHYAVMHNKDVRITSRRAVLLLLQYGADPEARDADGKTPLQYFFEAVATSNQTVKALARGRRGGRVCIDLEPQKPPF
jgi:cytohesin